MHDAGMLEIVRPEGGEGAGGRMLLPAVTRRHDDHLRSDSLHGPYRYLPP